MHRFIKNNSKSIHTTYTGNTLNYKYMYKYTKCNWTHNWYLSFYTRPPTAWKPSMNLRALYHAAQSYQQWVTPELGLNSTRVEGFLDRIRQYKQQEGFSPRSQIKLSTYIFSFPTWPSHPRKCAPSLLNLPSTTPLPFQGFNNMPNMKSQSTVTAVGILQEFSSPTILSPRESCSEAWKPSS